jgi:hypothetical protein
MHQQNPAPVENGGLSHQLDGLFIIYNNITIISTQLMGYIRLLILFI